MLVWSNESEAINAFIMDLRDWVSAATTTQLVGYPGEPYNQSSLVAYDGWAGSYSGGGPNTPPRPPA